jgi:SAM-dependent methyltransferase
LVIRTAWIDESDGSLSAADLAVLEEEHDLRGKRCLEVGIGKGLLFNEMAGRGADVVGVEPGHWGHSTHPVVSNVRLAPTDPKFDVIIANDVLEHLADPASMLEELRRRAHLGTTLYCRFPNNQSLRAMIRRGRWTMVRPLGHLHFFSRESAERVFSRTGWRIAQARALEISADSATSRLLNWIGLGDQWVMRAVPATDEP